MKLAPSDRIELSSRDLEFRLHPRAPGVEIMTHKKIVFDSEDLTKNPPETNFKIVDADPSDPDSFPEPEDPTSPLDSVPFVLAKQWLKIRGENVDLSMLVPGPITLMDDPEKDVREITWDEIKNGGEQDNRKP